MSDVTQTNMSRQVYISTVLPPTPAVWQQVTGGANIVNPERTRELHSYKATDTGGVTEQWAVWLTNGTLTFDLKYDDGNSVHVALSDALLNNTRILVNTYLSDVALVSDEFIGQVTTFTDSGTDGGVTIKSVVITPNSTIDHGATPAS
jgi:hypothetical protein